jgi:hypothetical protein
MVLGVCHTPAHCAVVRHEHARLYISVLLN